MIPKSYRKCVGFLIRAHSEQRGVLTQVGRSTGDACVALTLRARGLDIGSGGMEAACIYVVSTRM